jgi:hypothetical protein
MNAPVTANKPLTDIQDFHTSLMDSVRARAMDAQKQMDSFDYKYAPGQYVFTEHGAKNNLPPLKILEKSRHGWNIVREDPSNPLSKKIIDPATGKAQRTPYEAGYRVRRENGDDWSEFIIPQSAIKGDVELADGGKLVKGLGKVGKKLFADEVPKVTAPAVPKTVSAGDMVNGMLVRKDIPNQSSIGASLYDYSTHGVQEVPMSAFETVGKPRYRSVQEERYTKELARQIQENKELNPLIVVKDAEGHYILEGAHRFDALRELGIDSFPALMVHDLESLAKELPIPPVAKAEGGAAFKKLQFMGGGGITTSGGYFSPEELGVSADEIGLSNKQWNTIKRNAPEVYEWAKQNVKDEASQLKTGKGVKDFALRTGAQYLGGIPDLINLGLMGVDAGFDTKLSSEKPWFGSEQYINAMHKAGMLGENEFPIAETVAGILAPAGLIKKGVKKLRNLPSVKEEPKKRQGGLSAMAR